jgi:ribonuclease BN (tRNA processing enzyme)
MLLACGLLAFYSPAAPATPPAPSRAAPPLQVLVLGSGGPAALGRAAASYLVLLDGTARILVDSGPGSFARLGESHVSFAALDVVLLTHLHVDHAAELPGVIKARAVGSSGPISFGIYGPAGQEPSPGAARFPATSRFVELLFGEHGAFAYLKDFAAPVTLHATDIAATPAVSATPQILLRQGPLKISAMAGHHGDAPAIVYRIDYRGRSVVFSGDIDAQGLPALERLASSTSLLVFDAVVLDPPGSPQVLYSLHTPPAAIGRLAAAAQVGQLLLSHLSPAVEQHRAEVSASIATHYHGTVTYATDGMQLRP